MNISKKAFILTADDNPYGDDISTMVILAALSIRTFGGDHKDLPIYCGIFTKRDLPKTTKKVLKLLNVKVQNIPDYYPLTDLGKDNESVFNRHLCCYHYSKAILGRYEQLMYIDVDTVCMNPIIFYEDNGIMTDKIPDQFVHIDMKEGHYDQIHELLNSNGIKTYKGPYYSTWISQINQSNKHIWEEWFNLFKKIEAIHHNKYSRTESILMNKIIIENKIKIIDPIRIRASVPIDENGINAETIWCHYDSYDESGFLYSVFNTLEDTKAEKLALYMKAYRVKLPRSFIYQYDMIKNNNVKRLIRGLIL